jgi:hypothetical protein
MWRAFVNAASNLRVGRAVVQAVNRRFLTADAQGRVQVSLCGICGGQSGTGIGFSSSCPGVSYQYHSTAAPYSLICYL